MSPAIQHTPGIKPVHRGPSRSGVKIWSKRLQRLQFIGNGQMQGIETKPFGQLGRPHEDVTYRPEDHCTVMACTDLFSSLPSEMHLAIVNYVETGDLLSLSRSCRPLRYSSITTYLRRLGILRSCGCQHTIQLVGIIPPDAVSVLCSTPLFPEVHLLCDVSFVVHECHKLDHFLAQISIVSSVQLVTFVDKPFMDENAEATSKALSAFLAALSDRRCFGFSLREFSCHSQDTSFSESEQRFILPAISLAKVRLFVSNIRHLELSARLFDTESLWALSLLFSQSQSVESFTLTANYGEYYTTAKFDEFLRRLALPSLRHLRLFGNVLMSAVASFLSRHPLVRDVALVGRRHLGDLPIPTFAINPVILPAVCLHLSNDVVKAFFHAFELPKLMALHIVVGHPAEVNSLNIAFTSLSTFRGISTIRLQITFNSYVRPEPPLHGTSIGLLEPFEAGFYMSDELSNAERQLAPLVGLQWLEVVFSHQINDRSTIDFLLRWLSWFPSVRYLTIHNSTSDTVGEFADSVDWPTMIVEASNCDEGGQSIRQLPDLMSLKSPWGDWIKVL